MESQLLKDPMVKPDNIVLGEILDKKYKLFQEYEKITSELNLVMEWNYYNDGKNWLCKTLHKKKNLCWLSVWNTGFKLTFFFTEKTIGGFYGLDISDEIKTSAKETKSTWKLLPVLVLIKNGKVLKDAIKILEYKMTLK